MRVICLEGSHGCGKTELIKILAARGYNTLDEGFLNMPITTMHPQSFTMETIWASRWIERMLTIQYQSQESSNDIYFADRSPFSVLFYAPNGKIMEPIITEQVMDLAAGANIEIIIVYISVEKNALWKRISDRLVLEPERKKYHEDNYNHMIRALEFYENNKLWDYTVQNDANIDCTINSIINIANGKC
jgi:hypothetical protein